MSGYEDSKRWDQYYADKKLLAELHKYLADGGNPLEFSVGEVCHKLGEIAKNWKLDHRPGWTMEDILSLLDSARAEKQAKR